MHYRLYKSNQKLHQKADRTDRCTMQWFRRFKKEPDAKWKLKPEFIDNMRKIQAEVLESYSKIVKPGGKMVYATCSILPSENQDQIAKFYY
jgi:16S rRNA (cytosine967-C5)-methyltransferase